MIENYLNQTCGWKSRTGHDGYEPTYAASVTIACRWENKRRMVRNFQGVEVVSESTVYCKEAVRPNDTLTYDGRDCIVITVSDQPALDGTVSHREVYV